MAEIAANDEEFLLETRDASPAHLLMKIESFSLLLKHGMDKYESREFEAGGYRWRLIIYPNGVIKSGNDEGDHISVYLTIIENKSLPVGWEVNASFIIFLYNQLLDNYLCFQGKLRRFHAMKSQWGFSKLISKESLRAPDNGFLVDDKCVFGAEVAVIKTQRVTHNVSVREICHSYKCDFKISDFSILPGIWNSKEFIVGDHKWSIQLYPNGDIREHGRSVSVYSTLVGANSFASHKKVKANYILRIKNQLNDQNCSRYASHWFTSSSFSVGWAAFVPLSDMLDFNKGFLVKDCCIVEISISVKVVVS